MSDEDDQIDGSDAAELIEVVKREFEGVDRPVTATELARLYGVMAAQHEAILATFQVALQANPRLLFTDDSINAQSAMRAYVRALTEALRDLATASMNDEDRAKMEDNDGKA